MFYHILFVINKIKREYKTEKYNPERCKQNIELIILNYLRDGHIIEMDFSILNQA